MPNLGELSFGECIKLVQCGFPGARSRRPIRVEARETYDAKDYWDEGTRYKARFVAMSFPSDGIYDLMARADLGGRDSGNQKAGNPFNMDAFSVKLDETFCVVENILSGGKDLGYRIILHPSHVEDWRSIIR